jgi:hypothetical protein
MEPTFVKELVEPVPVRTRGLVWRSIAKGLRWFWRSLLSNPFAICPAGQEARTWAPWKVAIRMAICWTILIPILLGLTTVLSVFMGVHPSTPAVSADPASQGVYFENANLTSTDGTRLDAWIIPAIDAQRVIDEKDRTLRLSRPAIVLVHDYGRSMQQMLPLVRPLHDEGLVVLVLGLRGTASGSMAAQTFGINESKDVCAAVDLLRQTAFVNGSRIGVMGIGTGANAALIAASRDNAIRVVVLANPLKDRDAICQRISPMHSGLGFLQPVSERVFEIMCAVDSSEIDYARYAGTLKTRPNLLFMSPDFLVGEAASTLQIRRFCRAHLQTQELPRLGSAR